MPPPGDPSFIWDLKHPVVGGADIISEGTKHWRSSVFLNGNYLDFSALHCSSAKRVTRHAMYTCSLARIAKLRNVYCTRYWIPRTMPQYRTKQWTLCGFEEMSFAYIGLPIGLSSRSLVLWVSE